VSKYSGDEKEAVNSELLHSRRPIPVSNRYSVLTYLPESTIGEDEMASLGSGRVTQLYANIVLCNGYISQVYMCLEVHMGVTTKMILIPVIY
jgi:hypothetical protein